MLAAEVALPFVRFVFFLSSSQPPINLAIAVSSSTVCCDPCPRSRGCQVISDIELSVSARHHTTRILLHARRLLLVAGEVAVRGVLFRRISSWL